MNLRPKTVKRLVILLAACALITGIAASVLLFTRYTKEKQIQAARAAGMTAFDDGNYPLALEKLKIYIGRHKDDFDAMYAYADSRSRVETSDNRHIGEAKDRFVQLHLDHPDDIRVSHKLMELYERMGYVSESTRIAEDVLLRDPKDVEALRTKSNSLARSSKLSEALGFAQKLNEADPFDLDGQVQTLNLLRLLKRPNSEILSRYQQLLDAHPGDPRFEMLMGLAYYAAQDQENTLKWLRSAARRTPPDAAFVQRLSGHFDALKLFNESQELLLRAAADGNQPEIVKVLIERFWQNGRFQEVLDRLKDLDTNSPTVDPDLLAFKALSLYQLGQADDANSIIESLKKRTDSNKAAAWASALKTRNDASLPIRDAIKKYQSAMSRDPKNAVIRCWMGESYSRLGELDLAVPQWRQAVALAPSWAHPCVLLARAELLAGQTDDALKHATDALRRAPNLVESGVIMALASYRHLQLNPDAGDTDKLIAFLAEIQRGSPGEPETLPLLVELQAKSGKRDEAISTLRTSLQGERKLETDTLLKLVEISRQQNLGIESEIVAKLPADPSVSPRFSALERTLELARTGKKDDGLELLTKASSSATTQPVKWKVAVAQYRETIADPGAKAAWVSLGDEFPKDIEVQNLILKAGRSAVSDRDFFARTIERVHELTGDEALGWKLARARYLLTSEDKQRDSAEAVGILTTLVSQSPDTPEYRVLLAAGLINLGNTKGAIDHLKAAVDRDLSSVDTMIDLIKLLQAQGRSDEARSVLDRAVKSPNLTPANRKTLAIMLAQQGQILPAVNLLKPVQDSLDNEGQLVLAELLRRRGATSEAEAIFTDLLNHPSPSAEAIASAADFYASTDRLDQAKQLLIRLNDQRFSSAQRTRLLARFNEAYVSKDAAAAQYLAGANESSGDPEAWRALIEFYIRENRFDDAIAASDTGLGKLPANDALTMLKAQATALKSTHPAPSDLRPLIDALSKDPRNAAQVETLKAIQDARQTKQSPAQVVAKLKTVADKYPNYWPLQSQLVQGYVSLGQFNDAATVVERLMDARPNDADVARLAVSVYRSASRWRDMKRTAERLRQRTLEKPMEADVALAEVNLALGDPKAAAEQLSPYLESAKSNPRRSPPLTAIVAKLLVANGKTTEVKAMLQPLLSEGPSWRRLWLTLAAGQITPAQTASEWIRTGAASIPDTSPKAEQEEQLTVARAWQQMGARLNDKAATMFARDLLREMIDGADPGVQPALLLAALDADAGDTASAEALYRKVLERQADLPDALNNLAYLLLQRNGDLNDAKDLSTRAIALAPSVAALHDTLARINEKLDHREQAQSEFQEALRLEPTNLDARIGLCRVLNAGGSRDKASQELQRIDTQLNGTPPPNESTRRELQSLREMLSSSSSTE